MDINLSLAKLLKQLLGGESLPGSRLKNKFFKELIDEGILIVSGRQQKKVRLVNNEALMLYLGNKHNIHDLNEYIRILESKGVTRQELVAATGDSKARAVRSFKGFLVNSFMPIKARLNGEDFIVKPENGSFCFIYDFESFTLDEDVVIVGLENAENFRHIASQEYLFKGLKTLFVSRYPLNQSKDMLMWLQSIPNKYIHFGDFDLAGIGIYINEYKKHLGERASFLITEDIENNLIKYGCPQRYNVQKANFNLNSIEEKDLKGLVDIIHKYRKGLDQEFFIKGSDKN